MGFFQRVQNNWPADAPMRKYVENMLSIRTGTDQQHQMMSERHRPLSDQWAPDAAPATARATTAPHPDDDADDIDVDDGMDILDPVHSQFVDHALDILTNAGRFDLQQLPTSLAQQQAQHDDEYSYDFIGGTHKDQQKQLNQWKRQLTDEAVALATTTTATTNPHASSAQMTTPHQQRRSTIQEQHWSQLQTYKTNRCTLTKPMHT